MAEKVGFIGLGNIGNPMSRNVLKRESKLSPMGPLSRRPLRKRALLLLVVSVFTPPAPTGHAPRAGTVPAARRQPLDRILNDPLRALRERASVTPEATMAEGLAPEAAAA